MNAAIQELIFSAETAIEKAKLKVTSVGGGERKRLDDANADLVRLASSCDELKKKVKHMAVSSVSTSGLSIRLLALYLSGS